MFSVCRFEATVKKSLRKNKREYKIPFSRTLLDRLIKTSVTILLPTLLITGLSACNSDDDNNYISNNNDSGIVKEPVSSTYSKVTFIPAGSYVHGGFDESAAEITAFHPTSQRAFVVNAQNKKVDVLNLKDINKPTFIQSLDIADLGSTVNGVAVHGDIVALAVQANVKTDNGYVVLYDANTLARISSIEVGALPDMVTFTPDGKTLLVANEGEPDDEYKIDPEGSVSVINITDITRPIVKTATFTDYNAQKQRLTEAGVRIFGQKADGVMSTVAEDLEPEFIAVAKDGKTAYVSLQENNAIAIIDIGSATVTDIKGLGAKDHSKIGNELDVSNKDGGINITTWPIMGMYMPDAIDTYSIGNKTYLVTANEGDAREWGSFSEVINFKDVQVDTGKYNTLACYGLECGSDKALGKIDLSYVMGKSSENGVYDTLYSFGARSFSIWDTDNMSKPLYDSGSLMAKYIADKYPKHFNASNDKNDFDNRSDNKGVEPEGITIGVVGTQTIAFVGLERISSVMAFDVTDPMNVKLLGEINTRTFDDTKLAAAKAGTAAANADGDLGPEGLTFVSSKDSPSGKPLLLVGFEVSGTSRIFELDFAE